jgi:hypothetical protein
LHTSVITSPNELRQAEHKAVIAWERFTREIAFSESIRKAAISAGFAGD